MLLNPDSLGQGNAHLINQSLKPKMIMNNNSIPMQPGKLGMHQITSSQFQPHAAHAGDIVQMSGSNSNNRPASSKV
jgi:hypothetical protein